MIKFFIILLFVFLIWPIVKLIYYLYSTHRYVRKQQEAIRDAFTRAYEGTTAEQRHNSEAAPSRRRKKVFAKTDGEYVEFEEIACDVSDRYTSTTDGTTYIREEQISDAEWTEIK